MIFMHRVENRNPSYTIPQNQIAKRGPHLAYSAQRAMWIVTCTLLVVTSACADRTTEMFCEELGHRAAEEMRNVAETADRKCTRTADCVLVGISTNCQPSCTKLLLSLSGRDEVEAVRSSIEDYLCQIFDANGCVAIAPSCPRIVIGSIACVDGACESIYDQWSCSSCIKSSTTLTWSWVGGSALPSIHRIIGCRRYILKSPNGTTCGREIPDCSEPAEYHIDKVLHALDDSSVKAAFLQAPIHFGTELEPDEPFLQVKYMGNTIEIGSACPSSLEDCQEIPEGVLELRTVLLGVTEQEKCK